MGNDAGPGAVVMAVFRPIPSLYERQIASLRAQTMTDWTCLIGIDGADPETRKLTERLIEDDVRFAIHEYSSNVGVYRHFERLLRAVPENVTWLSLADQDDYWYPDKFERMLRAFDCAGVSAVTGQARLVNADGAILGFTRRITGSLGDILLRNQVSGALTIFRGSVLDRALPFPAATSVAIHDHWLGVVAAGVGRLAVLDEVVQDYVQHGRNVLGEEVPRSTGQMLKGIVDAGGVARYLDRTSSEHWGWRVSMADALVARNLVHQDVWCVRGVARGRISVAAVVAVLSNVVRGRLPVKVGIGMIASAGWWLRVRNGAAK